MSSAALRQKALGAVAVIVLLYAGAVAAWFLVAESSWKKAARQYRKETSRFAKEEKLISERKRWFDAYDTEKAAMPTFAADMATDTTWLRRIESVARTNLVLITQIENGKEVEAGDVRELPIEVKSFESSLEALVRFMHALENSEDGMYDIKEIRVQPAGRQKPGYLKGSMSLTCAYMREKE